MFISKAWATEAGDAAASFGFGDLVAFLFPFILIFAIFYFLLILPNKKRMEQHREMVEDLKRGDEILTAGGIIAKVAKPPVGDEVEVEISKNVRIRILRTTIMDKYGKSATEVFEAKEQAKAQAKAQRG